MSATILTVIVLIVMWVVVLVPLLVRRAEESEEAATLWAPAVAGAALATDPIRAETDLEGTRFAPGGAGSVGGGFAGSGAYIEAAEPEDAGYAERRAGSGRSMVLARRRRVLGMLAMLAVATASAAVLWAPGLWLAHAVCDALLLGYLGRLRSGARRDAEQRASRRRAAARTEQRVARTAPAAAPQPAVRRPSRPVDLDDEDPSFAQMEVRYPRAANE